MASHRLEPVSTLGGRFLVALLDPVFTATGEPAAFDLEE
jgi:hypothetical protein